MRRQPVRLPCGWSRTLAAAVPSLKAVRPNGSITADREDISTADFISSEQVFEHLMGN
jgi:hypothetical protein